MTAAALLSSLSTEAQCEPAIAAQALKPLTPDAPWRALQSYEEADHAYFRGRPPQVEELQSVIESQRLTVLYESVRARQDVAAPRWRLPETAGTRPTPRLRLIYSTDCLSLRMQVIEELRKAAQNARVEAPKLDTANLWEQFHRTDADFWSPNNHLITPVLVFDQFEELFSKALTQEKLCLLLTNSRTSSKAAYQGA